MDTREKKSFLDVFVDFMVKYRKLVLGLLALIVVFFVGLIVLQQIDKSKNLSAAEAMAAIDTAYKSWSDESDESKKASLETDLLTTINATAGEKNTAQQYAKYIEGNLYYSQKKYAEAAEAYKTAAEQMEASYLNEVSVYLAAVSFEEAEKPVDAITMFSKLASTEDTNPLTVRSILSLGRLYETDKQYDAAREQYNLLKSKYPNSSWTKFAQDRIIYLDTQKL